MDMENENKSRFSFLPGICIGVLIALCITYGMISYYFVDRFYLNTTIFGKNCSLLTMEEAQEVVEGAIKEYKITLHERGGQEEILQASQVGLGLKDVNSIQKCKEKQPFYGWITMLFKHQDFKYELSLSLNDQKLHKAIAMLSCKQQGNVVAPKDAYMTYDEKEKKYVIVPEVYGNTIDDSIFIPELKELILYQGSDYDLEENHCYLNPSVFETDEVLNKQAKSLNRFMTTVITYEMGDRTEVIDQGVLKDWISLNKQNEAVLDKDKVKDFVKKLAKKYDTLGKKRSFTSISGNSVKVSGGTYGWKIDQDKEYKELLAQIKKHESAKRKPVYEHIAKCRDKNDLGDTYVEIDLSKQHMWFYKNGKTKVSTEVVTGDVTKGRGTPTGVYYIVFKQRNHVLRGPGYASPVDYWMPFIEDRGIGIHDSSWRGSYGGDIFRGNGSHGCVNTPYDAVKKIYNNIEATYPVVVHW